LRQKVRTAASEIPPPLTLSAQHPQWTKSPDFLIADVFYGRLLSKFGVKSTFYT